MIRHIAQYCLIVYILATLHGSSIRCIEVPQIARNRVSIIRQQTMDHDHYISLLPDRLKSVSIPQEMYQTANRNHGPKIGEPRADVFYDYEHTPSSILGSFNIRGRASSSLQNTNSKPWHFKNQDDYDFLVPPPKNLWQEQFRPFDRISSNNSGLAKMQVLESLPKRTYPSRPTYNEYTYSSYKMDTTPHPRPTVPTNFESILSSFQTPTISISNNESSFLLPKPQKFLNNFISISNNNIVAEKFEKHRKPTLISPMNVRESEDFSNNVRINHHKYQKSHSKTNGGIYIPSPLFMNLNNTQKIEQLEAMNSSTMSPLLSNMQTFSKILDESLSSDSKPTVHSGYENKDLVSVTVPSKKIVSSISYKIPSYYEKYQTETPESISLKHFNEQQKTLQEQLIAHDQNIHTIHHDSKSEDIHVNRYIGDKLKNETQLLSKPSQNRTKVNQWNAVHNLTLPSRSRNNSIIKNSVTDAIWDNSTQKEQIELKHHSETVSGNETSRLKKPNPKFVNKYPHVEIKSDKLSTMQINTSIPSTNTDVPSLEPTTDSIRVSPKYNFSILNRNSTLTQIKTSIRNTSKLHIPTSTSMPVVPVRNSNNEKVLLLEENNANDDKFSKIILEKENDTIVLNSGELSNESKDSKLKNISNQTLKRTNSYNTTIIDRDLKSRINNTNHLGNHDVHSDISEISPLESLFNLTSNMNSGIGNHRIPSTPWNLKNNLNDEILVESVTESKVGSVFQTRFSKYKNKTRPRFSIKHHRNQYNHKEYLNKILPTNNTLKSVVSPNNNKSSIPQRFETVRRTASPKYRNGSKPHFNGTKSILPTQTKVMSDNINNEVNKNGSQVLHDNLTMNTGYDRCNVQDTNFNDQNKSSSKIIRQMSRKNRYQTHSNILCDILQNKNERAVTAEKPVKRIGTVSLSERLSTRESTTTSLRWHYNRKPTISPSGMKNLSNNATILFNHNRIKIDKNEEKNQINANETIPDELRFPIRHHSNGTLLDHFHSHGAHIIEKDESHTEHLQDVEKNKASPSNSYIQSDETKIVPIIFNSKKRLVNNRIDRNSEQPSLPIEAFFREISDV